MQFENNLRALIQSHIAMLEQGKQMMHDPQMDAESLRARMSSVVLNKPPTIQFNVLQNKQDKKIVVFFDGFCGLCSWAVDFLIARDKHKKFKYSPLQGEHVKSLGLSLDLQNLDTLYVYDGEELLAKTKAWRFLAFKLGGIWKFLALLSFVVPLFVWDLIYDFIAKNRYKIFGKRETCRLPTPEEQELFLL